SFNARVVAEARAGLRRLRQTKLGRRHGLDSVGRKQFAHFPKLARIMRGDDEAARDRPVRGTGMTRKIHITASFCRSTSLAMPFFASASSPKNCSSVNGTF